MRHFLALVVALGLPAYGCGPKQVAKPAAGAKGGVEPKKEPLPNDATAKEARAAATDILDRLLAGKLAQDESHLTRRAEALKRFTSWSIETQQKDEEGRVAFEGLGSNGKARFNMVLVKQQNGKWAVGSFGGPNPVE